MIDKIEDSKTALNQLIEYFSKVGKVKVVVNEQTITIEWKLNFFTLYKIEVNGGETEIRIRRVNDFNYITIKPRKNGCTIYVSPWLYFDKPVFPERFVLDNCHIVVEGKKKITITSSNVQYKYYKTIKLKP